MADAITRELTLEEAVALAILLQKDGHRDEAGAIYRGVLEVVPEHPDALHYAGVLAHQQGRQDEAVALIERSLVLVPDRADWHSNLGIVHQGEGSVDAAIAAYRRAIALDARHANAHNNLGVVLRAAGRPEEAEAAYRTAIAVDPKHADAYTNLGILLNSQRRGEEAAACFCKAITLRPRHPEARRLLALAHCTLGEIDEAVRIFESWLAEEPDNPIARHMLAACTGRGVPARASDAFVAATFDGFAASFEAKLERLSYRAPALVAAMVCEASLAPSRSLAVLDAGCGTGLCGPLVAPYASHLTGIDLSAGMLEHAARKQVYDALECTELTAYLWAHPASFDLIVSADTLVYFGDLADVFGAAAAALRPGGSVVATFERADDDLESGYRLETHGRYNHTRRYVAHVAGAAGLDVSFVDADLRMEAGLPVAGLVVRAMVRT